MDWTEYSDLSGEVLEAFKIDSFPTYVVLDKDGVMRFRQSGFGETTPGELEDAINKARKRASEPRLAAVAAASERKGVQPQTDEPVASLVAESRGAGAERDRDEVSLPIPHQIPRFLELKRAYFPGIFIKMMH